jgi:hypothetical protein
VCRAKPCRSMASATGRITGSPEMWERKPRDDGPRGDCTRCRPFVQVMRSARLPAPMVPLIWAVGSLVAQNLFVVC